MKSSVLSRGCPVVAAVALCAGLPPLSAAYAADAPATPHLSRTTVDSFGRVAQAVLGNRTSALLDGVPAVRGEVGAVHGVGLSTALARSERTALSALHGTRARLAAMGESYSAATTEVTVERTRLHRAGATVDVTESTVLTYRRIHGDEPPTTGFRAHHRLTFTARPDGTWQLTGVRLTDDGPRPVNEPLTAATQGSVRPGAVIDAPRASTAYPAPARPKKLTGRTKYNYPAMANYAEKYWKKYNASYRNFNRHRGGGDCTNFLSQSLKAGGWKAVTKSRQSYGTWWYGSSDQSETWVGVNEWSWFAQTARRTTPLKYAYQMDKGDVLQMDFDQDGSKDHSMMTTYRDSAGVPYLTYHALDTYRRSLPSIIASNPRSAYYAYRT
ncbi:amidase domain-containing protein [Streptomyces sp. NPDC046727]|uniref:amidase domain-containing protein n=1 Tax=Streptomyces sp. NPDC046727 TaxID=3155373 RepID=UPI0033C8D566